MASRHWEAWANEKPTEHQRGIAICQPSRSTEAIKASSFKSHKMTNQARVLFAAVNSSGTCTQHPSQAPEYHNHSFLGLWGFKPHKLQVGVSCLDKGKELVTVPVKKKKKKEFKTFYKICKGERLKGKLKMKEGETSKKETVFLSLPSLKNHYCISLLKSEWFTGRLQKLSRFLLLSNNGTWIQEPLMELK